MARRYRRTLRVTIGVLIVVSSMIGRLAGAEEVVPAAVAPSVAPAPSPPKPSPWRGRVLFHANMGVNVYTFQAATATAPVTHLSLGDRVLLIQLVGFGYAVHPKVRLQLTLQFGETVTDVPAGGSHFTLFGFIPWLVVAHAGFFVGTGPLILPRAAGKNDIDIGFALAFGYAHPIGKGFSLGATVQIPVLLLRRPSVGVVPTLLLAYRF